ncbi:type II toxin-antitoxin system VapC family toxin [Ancrocorticia populi]|uniref:type II toxin-antitoxin system VapC family toxin n=1 Tax=Ancrocorticia populi TaxID=2175228 RepID=UPI003F910EC2
MILLLSSADNGTAYFDTSAFVPLVIDELGTARCVQIWHAARRVIATRLLIVETAAALAKARRLHRLTDQQYVAAQAQGDRLLAGVDFIDVDSRLIGTAAGLARRFPLRGFDAVHVAGAALIEGTTMVSGDRQVLDACHELGMATADSAHSFR